MCNTDSLTLCDGTVLHRGDGEWENAANAVVTPLCQAILDTLQAAEADRDALQGRLDEHKLWHRLWFADGVLAKKLTAILATDQEKKV